MTDLPPELDEEDYEPQLPDPAGHDAFAADEREALVGFDNEDERAEMRPVDPDHQYGHGTPASGIGDTWYNP